MRRSHLSLFTHAPLVRALGFSSRPSLSQNSQCLESLHLFLYVPIRTCPTLSSFAYPHQPCFCDLQGETGLWDRCLAEAI